MLPFFTPLFIRLYKSLMHFNCTKTHFSRYTLQYYKLYMRKKTTWMCNIFIKLFINICNNVTWTTFAIYIIAYYIYQLNLLFPFYFYYSSCTQRTIRRRDTQVRSILTTTKKKIVLFLLQKKFSFLVELSIDFVVL